MSMWSILSIAMAITFGYYFRVWEHRHEMWHEQQVINQIEALGCSAYVGWNKFAEVWVAYGGPPDDIMEHEEGATRLIALSRLLNILEKRHG